MAKTPPGNIALLIDADNASHNGISPVLTVLAELGSVNIRRAYANWRKQALKGWVDKLHSLGIEPQQQFDMTRGKNATDMKMTIDAMDLLYTGRVDGFGIMSSDSDFHAAGDAYSPERGARFGFGSAKTPEAFQSACTRFIDVDALISAEGNGTNSPATPAKDSGKQSAAPKPKTKEPDKALLDLLIDAYNASKRDERGYASLSEVGNIAGNRSSFDVRNYGYKRLSDMIEAMGNFSTERRDNMVFVKRVR